MAIKTGTFEQYRRDVANGVYDYTDDGRCVGCGSCCSALLPLSKREIETIRRYIKKNHIKECKHMMPTAMPTIDMMCPFLDLSKPKDRCTIYPFRPEICRSFVCSNILGECTPELLNGVRVPVNMRETFYGT